MTYLLDTHYVLWAIADTKKLPKNIKSILSSEENKIIVSAISFWEISIKNSLGKLQIPGYVPEEFPDACLKTGFEIKPLSAEDSSTYHHLRATYHKDPFDRMLIWQAIRNNYTLITSDGEVKKYTSEGLKVLS